MSASLLTHSVLKVGLNIEACATVHLASSLRLSVSRGARVRRSCFAGVISPAALRRLMLIEPSVCRDGSPWTLKPGLHVPLAEVCFHALLFQGRTGFHARVVHLVNGFLHSRIILTWNHITQYSKYCSFDVALLFKTKLVCKTWIIYYTKCLEFGSDIYYIQKWYPVLVIRTTKTRHRRLNCFVVVISCFESSITFMYRD